MTRINGAELLAIIWGLSFAACQSAAQLQTGFYQSTCPPAENIVRSEVRKALLGNAGIAAGLVRMHFHDCFVRGCDGSVLVDSTSGNTAEKDAPPNNPSLRGFEVIDAAKSRLENMCPGVVSCADILAFAARDSVSMSGGNFYNVSAGRRDGSVSLASEVLSNLPGPAFNLNQLTQSFASKGLLQSEMITLSGAHTIGRSHCTAFSNRLYSFNSTVSQDPSLDPTYAAMLKIQCPQGGNLANLVVSMDPASPTSFDTSYYNNLKKNRGLFTSDQTLMSIPATAMEVGQNAANSLAFKSNFASAMIKMGNIGVLTVNNGKIRSNCRVV